MYLYSVFILLDAKFKYKSLHSLCLSDCHQCLPCSSCYLQAVSWCLQTNPNWNVVMSSTNDQVTLEMESDSYRAYESDVVALYRLNVDLEVSDIGSNSVANVVKIALSSCAVTSNQNPFALKINQKLILNNKSKINL